MVLLKTTGQCEHLAPTNQSLNIDDRSTDHQPVRNLRTKKFSNLTFIRNMVLKHRTENTCNHILFNVNTLITLGIFLHTYSHFEQLIYFFPRKFQDKTVLRKGNKDRLLKVKKMTNRY